MLKKFKDHNLTKEVYFYYVRTFLYFMEYRSIVVSLYLMYKTGKFYIYYICIKLLIKGSYVLKIKETSRVDIRKVKIR